MISLISLKPALFHSGLRKPGSVDFHLKLGI